MTAHHHSLLYRTVIFVLLASPIVSDAIHHSDLLPRNLFPLDEYDVLRFDEGFDEDVIHLRKRSGAEDCDTDCMNYSGWSDNGVMQCENEDAAEDNEAQRRALLMRRGRKKSEDVCKDVVTDLYQGGHSPGFFLFSPTWPSLNDLERDHKTIYDTGDPRKPLKQEWFELKKHSKRWTDDVIGKKNAKRCYDAEHVLEWQLLLEFIQDDAKDGKFSRCSLLEKFFLKPMPNNNYKVKVAKNNGELQKDDHFEYEDFDHVLSPFEYKSFTQPRYIDWIMARKGEQQAENPWEYELVLLNKDVNIKKENVWGNKELFVQPELEKGTNRMKNTQENSKTLNWLFENKYYEGSVKAWPDNKGTCKAVYNFGTVMSISQYHNDLLIKEIMRAQVQRVGEAWELMEKEISAVDKTYQTRGLKKEWLDWMEKIHKERLGKLNKALDEGIKVFHGSAGIITKLKRWDYRGVFRRVVDEPNCGFEKQSARMQDRVKLLKDAYSSMKKVDEVLQLN